MSRPPGQPYFAQGERAGQDNQVFDVETWFEHHFVEVKQKCNHQYQQVHCHFRATNNKLTENSSGNSSHKTASGDGRCAPSLSLDHFTLAGMGRSRLASVYRLAHVQVVFIRRSTAQCK